MTKLIDKKDLLEGTEDTQDVIIPKTAKKIITKVDRSDLLDPTVGFGVQTFVSADNGVSFRPKGGFGAMGGAQIDTKTGQPYKYSSAVDMLPPDQGFDYIVRTTLTLTKPAKVSLDVEEYKE